jgi:hypothetical protein
VQAYPTPSRRNAYFNLSVAVRYLYDAGNARQRWLVLSGGILDTHLRSSSVPRLRSAISNNAPLSLKEYDQIGPHYRGPAGTGPSTVRKVTMANDARRSSLA